MELATCAVQSILQGIKRLTVIDHEIILVAHAPHVGLPVPLEFCDTLLYRRIQMYRMSRFMLALGDDVCD